METNALGSNKFHGLIAGALILGSIVGLGAVSYATNQTLTPELRKEYVANWNRMAVRKERLTYVDARVDRISHFQKQYEAVSRVTDVPWYMIAVLDEMESGGGACKHLHNGDSLKRRTVNVPAGRPKDSDPPFTWYVSALDALEYDGLTNWSDWSVAGILYRLELYNGWGYRRHTNDGRPIPSPYLWSYSNVYSFGKFVKDGVFHRSAVSDQVGAAVLLRRMVDRHFITITGREVKAK